MAPIRLLDKDDPRYDAEMSKAYPFTFSVKGYAYFFTREEWEAIPVVNTPPSFNPATEYLQLVEQEENGQVVRRWVVDVVPPVE